MADHASLERLVYPGATHSSAIVEYFDDLIVWLEARVDSEPAIDQCDS
jgi:hypothetical protein